MPCTVALPPSFIAMAPSPLATVPLPLKRCRRSGAQNLATRRAGPGARRAMPRPATKQARPAATRRRRDGAASISSTQHNTASKAGSWRGRETGSRAGEWATRPADPTARAAARNRGHIQPAQWGVGGQDGLTGGCTTPAQACRGVPEAPEPFSDSCPNHPSISQVRLPSTAREHHLDEQQLQRHGQHRGHTQL